MPATDTSKVARALSTLKAGDLLKYEMLRGGKPLSVEVAIPAGLTVPTLSAPKTRPAKP